MYLYASEGSQLLGYQRIQIFFLEYIFKKICGNGRGGYNYTV